MDAQMTAASSDLPVSKGQAAGDGQPVSVHLKVCRMVSRDQSQLEGSSSQHTGSPDPPLILFCPGLWLEHLECCNKRHSGSGFHAGKLQAFYHEIPQRKDSVQGAPQSGNARH